MTEYPMELRVHWEDMDDTQKSAIVEMIKIGLIGFDAECCGEQNLLDIAKRGVSNYEDVNRGPWNTTEALERYGPEAE